MIPEKDKSIVRIAGLCIEIQEDKAKLKLSLSSILSSSSMDGRQFLPKAWLQTR